MPTLHREAGLAFRFRAADGIEPAHVHVYGNGGSAKVWLRPVVRFAEVRGYDVRWRKTIKRITEEHRYEWLAAWSRFFDAR